MVKRKLQIQSDCVCKFFTNDPRAITTRTEDLLLFFPFSEFLLECVCRENSGLVGENQVSLPLSLSFWIWKLEDHGRQFDSINGICITTRNKNDLFGIREARQIASGQRVRVNGQPSYLVDLQKLRILLCCANSGFPFGCT